MLKSAVALSRPAAAESLNDLSPVHVMSNSSPTFTASALGAPVVPAGAAVVACAGTDSGAAVLAEGTWVVADVALSSSSPQAAGPGAATTPAASKRLLMIIFSPFSGNQGWFTR